MSPTEGYKDDLKIEIQTPDAQLCSVPSLENSWAMPGQEKTCLPAL